jgi:hypothetical protein
MITISGWSTRPRSRLVVVAPCSAAIVVDGYDLIVHGTVVPPWSARLPSGSSVRSAPSPDE